MHSVPANSRRARERFHQELYRCRFGFCHEFAPGLRRRENHACHGVSAMHKKLFDDCLQRRPRRHHIIHYDEWARRNSTDLDIAAEVPAAGGFVEGGLVRGGVDKRQDIGCGAPAEMAHG